MADKNSTIKTTVVLDASQAQQEIAKLNAIATDSTASVEEKLEAKNQQVEIQNQLSKQTIENLEDEIKLLEGLGAEQKDIAKVQKKLNTERVKATKLSANGAKQQRKLTQQLKDSKDSMKGLDDATGGVIGKFKAFIANPIGITLTVIAGLFTTLKEATERSGEASETWNKIASKLSGILNGIMAVLEPLVVLIGEKFLQALENPMQAIEDIGAAIQENLINRVKSFLVLGDAISALFEGDFEKASKLAADGFLQLATGVEDATDKMANFVKENAETFNEARKATEGLANSERDLLKVRQDLEKQQLTSLRLAEEQRQIRDDISLSFEERIAANTKLGEILEEQIQREMQLAQIALDAANQRVIASGETIENLEAVGDAELKLLEIQERIGGQRSEQLVNEQALIKERADAKLAEAEADKVLEEEARDRSNREIEAQIEIDQIKLERKRAQGEDVLALELELLRRSRDQELENTELTEAEKQLIIEKYKDAEVEVNASADEAKVKSADAAAQGGIAAAADVFGISQEVAVAQMLMAAPEAIAGSFKEAAKAYTPPWSIAMGALGAAGTVAPIIKGLADIKKTRFSKKKGGSPGGSISRAPSAGGGASPPTDISAVADIAANNSARLGIDPSIGGGATQNASANVQGGASGNVTFSEEKYSEFNNQVAFKEEKTTIG